MGDGSRFGPPAANDDDDGDDEEVCDEAEQAFVEETADAEPHVVRRRPSRPSGRRTPMLRIALNGPGQPQVKNTKPPQVFMTHLPDSPPRPRGVKISPAAMTAMRATVFTFTTTKKTGRKPCGGEDMDSSPSSRKTSSDKELTTAEPTSADASVVSEGEEGEEEESEARPEMDESAEMSSTQDPVAPQAVHIASLASDGNADMSDKDTDDDSDETEDDSDDEEYNRLRHARLRLEQEQQQREATREELAAYVASLTSRRDEDGDTLVEFPRNFAQIVSLMTTKDIEPVPKDEGKAAATSASDRHKTWSEILIQNSLAKQQAYGVLDDLEGGGDEESNLSAKIALKMARVRQLDAILEERLGKNLYAGIVPAKKKKTSVGSESMSKYSSRVPNTKEAPASVARGPSTSGSIALNHVERNKKVAENGGKGNLTRDEEQRLKRLMREDKAKSLIDHESNAGPQMDVAYKLDQSQNQEIDRLIQERRGVYQSAVTMALNDGIEEGTEDEPTKASAASQGKHRKPMVVIEDKKERERKQKLRRIEEELQFLHENEAVPILPDEDDDDDCRSERSYMTTTSILSTCSTRSGVTRRQLDQFVATEVSKPECSAQKASSDEIKKLLSSLSHISIATSRPSTTTV